MNFNKNVDITSEIMDAVYRECALTGLREQLPFLERDRRTIFKNNSIYKPLAAYSSYEIL